MIAKNVSNKMLQNQITEQNTKLSESNYYNYDSLIDDEEIISNYNVSLNGSTILMIYGI